MKKLVFVCLASSVLGCFASLVYGKERIAEFNGSESATTADFEVVAPWIVDWRVTGDYPGSMGVHVDLVNAESLEHVGKVVSTRWVTDGVRLFNEGGKYRLQVKSTLANWTLIVEQLTREEAEEYTPRTP